MGAKQTSQNKKEKCNEKCNSHPIFDPSLWMRKGWYFRAQEVTASLTAAGKADGLRQKLERTGSTSTK